MEKNLFDQLSHKYDTKERFELAKIIQNEIRPDIVEHTNKSLLDYGCGTGLVSLDFSKEVKSLILADASSEMLQLTKQKIEQLGLTNATTIQLDLIKEDTDIKVDTIITSLVLLHVPDTSLLLEKLYASLNEGGQLIIVDFDLNEKINDPRVHNGFDQDKLTALLEQTGFNKISSNNFHSGKNLFMKQDATLFKAVASK